MKPTITFLGTGDSKPTKKRNHSAILLSYNSENILFDCGEGTQRQFRIAGINPCKLTRIFITHWHGDHTLGIPGLLFTLNMSEYNKKLHIYGPKGTKDKIKMFEKIYGGFNINLEVHDISKETVLDEPSFTINAKPMSHGINSYAYSFIIKNKLRIDKKKLKKIKISNSPLLAKLQQGKDIIHPETKKKIFAKKLTYLEEGKKITIILDTSKNPNAPKLAKNSDLLICESSFSSKDNEKAKQHKHLTSQEAATIAKKSKTKKLILTHVSQRYEKNMSPILLEAKKIFKKTTIAEDFEKITV